MIFKKQSTATTILIGPFLDDTDGKTAETGLTIAQASVRLSKNAGNMAQKNEATSCTHDELGYYTCPLDTTDTGTLGELKLMVHVAGALPVWNEIMILPANVYDSLVAGTDYLQADAVQVEGADATDTINAACDTALSDYDGPTNAQMEARTIVAADYATAADLATVDGIVDDILTAVETDIPGTLAGLNNISSGDVEIACGTALSIYGATTQLDLIDRTVLAADYALESTLAGVASNVTDILEDTGDALPIMLDIMAGATFDTTTDSLEAIRNRGDAAWTGGGAAPTVEEIRAEIDSNSTQLAAIVLATETTIPGTITTLQGNVTSILEDTDATIPGVITAMQTDVTEILDYEAGDWSIVNDQMIFETKAGATLATYDLTKDGVADSESPDARTKV